MTRSAAELPDGLSSLLPASTARAWVRVAPAVPAGAVLYGGTGISAHLLHRVSRDLDFFVSQPFEPHGLAERLSQAASFVTTSISEGTLNGVFDDTKVQFLDAQGQVAFEPVTVVGGLAVAGLGDLLATKLKVIGDRGALRDYFDIMVIENAGRSVEEGIGIYIGRYGLDSSAAAATIPIRGLLYMDDVVDDPTLPVARKVVERYWATRRRSLLASFDRL